MLLVRVCGSVQEEDKDSRKKAVAASLGSVVSADGTDERADEEVGHYGGKFSDS